MLQFPAAEFFYEGPDVAAFQVVKQGELIPPTEESYNHTARVCRIGADNKLYIALGQPFNVPAKDKLDLYKKTGIGGIIRMDQDGKNREVYATGVRNSVGIDFNPVDRTLWFTDNQVDGMGDDQPPGELNRADPGRPEFRLPVLRRRRRAHCRIQGRAGAGRHRGAAGRRWRRMPPISGSPSIPGTSSRRSTRAASSRPSTAPGTGPGRSAPGSCSRRVKPDGTADKPQVFADGWLTETGEYIGRPVDVAQLLDGSLLVSDDTAGAIYRISYGQ